MNLKRLCVAAATLALAVAAVSNTATATLNTRHFYDGAAGVDFGQGAGLYDPAGPTYCAALRSFYEGASPVAFYYNTPTRYEPGLAVSHVEGVNGPGTPVPACTGTQLNVDLVGVDAGSAVWSYNLLDATQVANLGATTLGLQYCDASGNPTAVPGSAHGVDLGVVQAFGASAVACDWYGAYTLYDGAGACSAFSMSTSVGALDGDRPVFLVDGSNGGSCSSLVGSGQGFAGLAAAVPALGSDYVAQACLSTATTDVMTGAIAAESDSDFFTVGMDGSLLAWNTATPMGTQLFPNVANLEPNAAASDCDWVSPGVPSNPCNGYVDVFCDYCSYDGGNIGESWRKCIDEEPPYYWAGCTLWVSNQCQVG